MHNKKHTPQNKQIINILNESLRVITGVKRALKTEMDEKVLENAQLRCFLFAKGPCFRNRVRFLWFALVLELVKPEQSKYR